MYAVLEVMCSKCRKCEVVRLTDSDAEKKELLMRKPISEADSSSLCV